MPSVDSIEIVADDAEALIEQWRYRFDDFLKDNQRARDALLAQLVDAGLELTRRRIETLRAALAEHRDRIAQLFAAAGIEPRERRSADPAPLPGEGTVTAYYQQIHRDWGWDGAEVRDALACIERAIGDARLGHMAVLGAGACRLSVELHLRRCESTVAYDMNPLPFFVVRRLLAGEPVRLFELPLRPRTAADVCVDRTLKCDPVDGFSLVFADALRPPLGDASVDTVLTPWFIDQIPRDVATLVPQIHRVLNMGGRWINHGPSVYQPAHTKMVHRYPFDEVLALVEAGGFEVVSQSIDRLRYLESPVGNAGRSERVLTFCAVKKEAPPVEDDAPPWLADVTLPIERLAGLAAYEAPHPMFRAVASFIDGERSSEQIAKAMVRSHGLPADAAVAGVQACLREIWRALQS